ncbi:MAG TPA: hypothetical protein VMC09_01575 [Anaerolineales bacterium]|nr:hypothetical protein [Anaerolineales bacterium]
MVANKVVALWPGWIFPGIPIPFWVQYSSQIGEFIQRNKLQAATEKDLAAAGMSLKAAVMPKAEVGVKQAFDLGIKGGNRIHLHFKDQIYLLTDQQWNQFSGRVIETCKAKLAGAKTIDFETTVMLGAITEGLR